MNFEQLTMWLQGALETRDVSTISHSEARALLQNIKEHVALQFKKVTPDVKVPEGLVKRSGPADDANKALNDLVKRHVIKPSGVEVKPLPWFPPGSRGFEYDKPDYWTGDHKGNRMIVTC